MKAWLEEAGQIFDRTHNLINLLNQILPFLPAWNALSSDLNVLNDYAVDYRYPGMNADKVEARTALNHCRAVRKAVRQSFNLPV